jgi:dTMP kinase
MKKKAVKGKLIVFEGLDASGKHTQCELFLKELKRHGFKTAFYEFPAYATKFGRIIKKYLAGEYGDKNALPPQAIALLYALDRAQFRKKIEKDLKENKIVVCDRYTQSNLYQAAKLPRGQRPKFEEWAKRLEAGAPRADCVVFLDVPLAHGRKLLKKRGRKIDVHEADVRYQGEVRREYLKAAKRNKKWFVINCVERGVLLSREEIAARAWTKIKKLVWQR